MTWSTTVGWAALVIAVVANVGANLLLKLAVARGEAEEGNGPQLLQNLPVLIAGVALAGILLVAYVTALRHLPVSLAYPIVTGTAMVGIALLSAGLLAEPLTVGKAVGILLIVLGTILLMRG